MVASRWRRRSRRRSISSPPWRAPRRARGREAAGGARRARGVHCLPPRRGRPAPRGGVCTPTRHDVLSLVALLGWFGRALVSHDHLGAEDLAGLGRLWEPVDLEQALACYRAALTSDLAGPAAHRARLRLARWEKRAARRDAAGALWETARFHDAFDREPWGGVAKFHEHRRARPPAARPLSARGPAG